MVCQYCLTVIVDAGLLMLTKVTGFLDTLDEKKGVSVMADRGFTV